VRAATDPRLAPCMAILEKFRAKPGAPLENITLDYDQFEEVLSGNLPLLTKIFRNDMVIPEWESFTSNVTRLYEKFRNNFDGAPASYIPQLARVPSEKWGISICTVDGQRFSIGDVNDKFTIQSTRYGRGGEQRGLAAFNCALWRPSLLNFLPAGNFLMLRPRFRRSSCFPSLPPALYILFQ